MSERGELADVLGALPESYNLTWANDEQTTSLMIDVEILADAVLESPWLRAHDDRIRAEAWDEGYETATTDMEARSAPPGPCGPVDPTMNPYDAAALRAAAGTPTHDTTEEKL